MSEQISPTPAPYIQAFEQLGFGMFVHYGLYSQLGGGEWYFSQNPSMSMSEYEKLSAGFAPGSAADIVAVGKAAGCKYICLTTRHHEGFSLYDTRGLSDFDAVHTPYGKDFIAEFVEACRRADIVPFFYHTTLDWHHPDFEDNFDNYLDYLYKSVELLCTHYGKIGGLWFDGNWSKPNADWQEDRLYKMIHRLQPDAMIINNTGLHARGAKGNPEIDAVTYERGMAEPIDRTGMKKYISGEMCQTLCDHWGIADDINFKSVRQLIEELCLCRKVGANYLLNIGPAADASVPTMQRAIMETVGQWMHIYGEAIYNGRPCGMGGMGKNFALKSVDGKYLYLFVYDLMKKGSTHVVVGGKYSGAYAFGNVIDQVSSIKWMDEEEELDFIQDKGMLCVNFTGQPYGKSYPVRVAKARIKE